MELHPIFVATSNLQLNVLDGALPKSDQIIVELYCKKVSDVVWQLDEKKILNQLEVGRPITHLKDYLEKRVKNELPKTTLQFLKDIESKSSSLSFEGIGSIINCSDQNLAKLLANDSKTKKFCIYADGGKLIIPKGMENKFKAGVKKLGYFLKN